MTIAALAGILLLAALLQIGLARLEGPFGSPQARSLSGDEKRYIEVASAWAAGEAAELDPLWPPGYPATVALVLRAGGSLSWVVGLQILALLVAGVALGRIALEAGLPAPLATLAGAFLVLQPEVAAFARLYRPEAMHLALFLVALWLAVRSTREESPRPLRLVLLGCVLAAAIALKSLLLPLTPLVVLATLWLPPTRPWRDRLVRGLLVALPLVALLTPVVLFQHDRSGVWTVGGSARFNLWVGLTDRSSRSLAEDRSWEEYLRYRAGGETFEARQDALTRDLRDLVAARGLSAIVAGQWPRQLFRLLDRESYFSAMLPPGGSRFLAGEGYRDPPPGLARLLGAVETGLYAGLLLLAPFGLVQLFRERRPGAGWVAALLVYQTTLFYFVHVKARYRLTLLPLLALGAVFAIESLRRRHLEGRAGRAGNLPFPAVDLALGGGGALLLLYFAFGAS